MNLEVAERIQGLVADMAKEKRMSNIPQLQASIVEFSVPKGYDPDDLARCMIRKVGQAGYCMTIYPNKTQTRVRIAYKT